MDHEVLDLPALIADGRAVRISALPSALAPGASVVCERHRNAAGRVVTLARWLVHPPEPSVKGG
jgi:hypothetical protein